MAARSTDSTGVRVPRPRRSPEGALRSSSETDPIPDVDALIADISDTGMDPSRTAFISFHVRFDDRPRWENAAAVARSKWQVSLYSSPAGYMLRLSRQAEVTRESLARLRAEVQALVAKLGAVWESVTVEELSGANEWKALQAQQRADKAGAAVLNAVPDVTESSSPSVHAGPSGAGEVA